MAAVQETIPVLDLGSARRADGSFSPEFIEQLRDATHRVGFFQVIGYGGTPGQAKELLATIRRFFKLPLEARMKLDNRLSPHFRGYTRMGTEITQGKADAREQIDYSPNRQPVKDYPADQPYWLLQGPNLWPDEAMPELEPAAMAWAELMSGVGAELMRAIAVTLRLPEDYFGEPFQGSPAWMGKLVHYVGGVVEAAGDQGVGSHADYGFVTLLLQDSIGGLEVLPPGANDWAPGEAIPGA